MAIILIESFDHFDTHHMGAKFWNGPDSVGHVPGRGFVGGWALNVFPNNPDSKNLPSSYSTLIVGAAFHTHLWGSGHFLELQGSGNIVCTIGQDGHGHLRLTDAANRTFDGTTPLPDNVWYYVEVKVTVGTSGTGEVHLNAAPEIASSVGNFGTHNIDKIVFTLSDPGGSADHALYVDDVYVADTSGSSPQNNFLGDVVVRTLLPNGDGAHSQWTPLVAGPHYQMVDEDQMDGDGSYVYDSTVGHIDSYTMEDLPGLTVYSTQLNVAARKGDSGLRQIAPLIRQAGTDYVGPTFTTGDDYAFYSWILDKDPTNAAWTVATVNADECGVKTIA